MTSTQTDQWRAYAAALKHYGPGRVPDWLRDAIFDPQPASRALSRDPRAWQAWQHARAAGIVTDLPVKYGLVQVGEGRFVVGSDLHRYEQAGLTPVEDVVEPCAWHRSGTLVGDLPGEHPSILGLAVPFDTPVYILKPTGALAFRETVLREAVTLAEGSDALPLLVEHAGKPVGRVVEWHSRETGLFGRWAIHDAAVHARVLSGELGGLSIAWRVAPGADEWTDLGGVPSVTRRRVDLTETSLVRIPAYPGSRVLTPTPVRAVRQRTPVVASGVPTPNLDAARLAHTRAMQRVR